MRGPSSYPDKEINRYSFPITKISLQVPIAVWIKLSHSSKDAPSILVTWPNGLRRVIEVDLDYAMTFFGYYFDTILGDQPEGPVFWILQDDSLALHIGTNYDVDIISDGEVAISIAGGAGRLHVECGHGLYQSKS